MVGVDLLFCLLQLLHDQFIFQTLDCFFALVVANCKAFHIIAIGTFFGNYRTVARRVVARILHFVVATEVFQLFLLVLLFHSFLLC